MKSQCPDIFEKRVSILRTIQSARSQRNGQKTQSSGMHLTDRTKNFFVFPYNLGHFCLLSHAYNVMEQACVYHQHNDVCCLRGLTFNTTHKVEGAYCVFGQSTLSHCIFINDRPFCEEKIARKHAAQTDAANDNIGNSPALLMLPCTCHSKGENLRSSYPEHKHNVCIPYILLIKQQNKYADSNHMVCGHKSTSSLGARTLSAASTRKLMAATAVPQHNNAKTYNLSNIDSVSETKSAFCSRGIVQKESFVCFSVQVLKKEKDANAIRTVIHNGLDSMFFECMNIKLSCYLCQLIQHTAQLETIVPLFNISGTGHSIKDDKKLEVTANDNSGTFVDRTVVIQEKI